MERPESGLPGCCAALPPWAGIAPATRIIASNASEAVVNLVMETSQEGGVDRDARPSFVSGLHALSGHQRLETWGLRNWKGRRRLPRCASDDAGGPSLHSFGTFARRRVRAAANHTPAN